MLRTRRSKANRSHKVNLCTFARPRSGGPGKGRSVSLFAFSYLDVAHLFGLKVKTVQVLAKKGAFRMTDLESLFSYFQKRRPQIPPPVEAAPVDPGVLN